uniref:Uncharacterized protein n=1 Tax=Kalmanozyma brasiliensis (strain GHG001) TaxID=1365824 RepID=V5GKK9_KALBG
MTAQGGSSPTALGIPGSLKAIFGASDAHNPTATDEYVDEILPEYLPGSLLSSNATISRRSRLDDSAGEGLRRNVLVRNAMLSSLERERRQMSQEILDYYTVPSSPTEGASSTAVALDEEAQFFEDLLSELSGGDGFNAASSELPPTGPSPLGLCPIKDDAKLPTDEEDFVKLDSDLPSEPVLAQLVSSSYQAAPREAAPEGSQLRAKVVDRSALTLVDSCVASCSETPGSDESSFAEATSRLIPASSCCSGYPNVCPYPATSSSVGGSSEELPALVDDNDSDLDEDEDEDEVEDQVQDRHEGEVYAPYP